MSTYNVFSVNLGNGERLIGWLWIQSDTDSVPCVCRAAYVWFKQCGQAMYNVQCHDACILCVQLFSLPGIDIVLIC